MPTWEEFKADLLAEISWEETFGDSGRESPWSRRDREESADNWRKPDTK